VKTDTGDERRRKNRWRIDADSYACIISSLRSAGCWQLCIGITCMQYFRYKFIAWKDLSFPKFFRSFWNPSHRTDPYISPTSLPLHISYYVKVDFFSFDFVLFTSLHISCCHFFLSTAKASILPIQVKIMRVRQGSCCLHGWMSTWMKWRKVKRVKFFMRRIPKLSKYVHCGRKSKNANAKTCNGVEKELDYWRGGTLPFLLYTFFYFLKQHASNYTNAGSEEAKSLYAFTHSAVVRILECICLRPFLRHMMFSEAFSRFLAHHHPNR